MCTSICAQIGQVRLQDGEGRESWLREGEERAKERGRGRGEGVESARVVMGREL